jgi:hypothetical protein
LLVTTLNWHSLRQDLTYNRFRYLVTPEQIRSQCCASVAAGGTLQKVAQMLFTVIHLVYSKSSYHNSVISVYCFRDGSCAHVQGRLASSLRGAGTSCRQISFFNEADIVIPSGKTVDIACNGFQLFAHGSSNPMIVQGGATLRIRDCVFSNYFPGETETTHAISPTTVYGLEEGSTAEVVNSYVEHSCVVSKPLSSLPLHASITSSQRQPGCLFLFAPRQQRFPNICSSSVVLCVDRAPATYTPPHTMVCTFAYACSSWTTT